MRCYCRVVTGVSGSFLRPHQSRLQEQHTSPRHAPRPCTLLPGERPLLLMITPRHHCTRMHIALAIWNESEWACTNPTSASGLYQPHL